MPKVQGDPEDLRLAVIFLRSLRHWDKGRLAAESGVSRNMISAYELGALPPLGSLVQAPVYVDPEVMAHDTVVFAAGSQTESVKIRPEDLFTIRELGVSG